MITAGDPPITGGAAPAPQRPRWFDSHCHLQDAYRPDGVDVDAAVAEAVAHGVGGLVCVGTDASSSRQAIDLAVRLDRGRHLGDAGGGGDAVFRAAATVGLHPHDASAGLGPVEEVLALALDPAGAASGVVVAVGECGLDYHYDHSPRRDQRDVFAAQVAMAKQHDLALVVHTRDAWDDTVDVLAAAGLPERTVVHCFTGGPDEARRCLDLGATLSFSGIVTFKNAADVREAARLCPADRLLVETDAPFLAPVPHRGQPNRPAWVSLVGEAVAELRGVGAGELAATTSAAARSLFRLGPAADVPRR